MSADRKLKVPTMDKVADADILPLNKSKKANAPSDIKDHSLVARLKKSGLDPQKLLDLSLPAKKVGLISLQYRHTIIRLSLILLVLIPSILFSIYMYFVASDQYHSSVAFAVRSSSSSPATEILGMVLEGGADNTRSNSYILHDYLKSQTVVEEIGTQIDFESIFNRAGQDLLFSMGKNLPIEDRVDYWNKMVDVEYDSTSGVIFVQVRTFDPHDSVAIAKQILMHSEKLVNNLSEANRRESVRFAEHAVARAETRLKAIKKQLLNYRELTQEISPEDNARLAVEMIAGLEQLVSRKEAELTTLGALLDTSSPQIRILTGEISALKSQVKVERAKLGAGYKISTAPTEDNEVSGKSVAFRIADYSSLKLEEEFANQLFVTALASLEQARQDADMRHMYLATFISPTKSDEAQYPSRALFSVALFLLLAGAWIVSVLMYYNIRDRN